MIRKILLLFALLFAGSAKAQTTVNFNGCNGTPNSPFQGINFSSVFWCEKVWLQNSQTLSLSQNITTATFKFISTSVLDSLDAGDVGSGGLLTITTDAGEKFSIQVPGSKMLTGVSTGFKLPASVITVTYSNSWFLELNNLVYTEQTAQPPGILAKLTLTYDDNSAFAGSAQVVTITTVNGVITGTVIVSQMFDLSGSVTGFITIDPAQTYNVFIVDPNPPINGTCPTTEALTTVINNGISVQECAVYQSPVLLSGVLVSGLKSATLSARVSKTSGQILSENYSVQ